MNGIADKEIQGLVNMMKSMKNQGYKFGAFIDLHAYCSALGLIYKVPTSIENLQYHGERLLKALLALNR